MPQETHITDDPDIQSALPEGQDQAPPRQPKAGDGSNKSLDVVNFDTGAVLDLFKQKIEEAEVAEKEKTETDVKAKADVESKAKVKTDADAKAKIEDEAKAKPDLAAAKIDAEAKTKIDADAKVKAVEVKPKSDVLDSVELPPQAKARSGEAFAKVKELARQEIKKREDQITSQTEKISKAEADLAAARKELESRPTVDPAVEKELGELRNWRKQIDVEADPKWKEFDTRVTRNQDAILLKLAAHGMSKKDQDEAKRLNFQINWDDILPKLPSDTRRFVEAKLVENESLEMDKKEALQTAKSKADEFLKERASTEETRLKQAIQEEQKVVNHFLSQLEWTKKQEVKADAPTEQKAQAEAANKFIAESEDRLKQLMDDRSPNTRAQMIVGTLLAYKYKADLAAKEQELDALKTSHKAEIEKTKEELKMATEELDRVKKASGAGRRPSNAVMTSKSNNDLIRPGGDALDQLRNEVIAAE